MKNEYGIVGVAHIGLPTNDLKKTIEFYKSLGFEVILETYNEKAKEKVAFLQIQNYCIESFENGQAVRKGDPMLKLDLDYLKANAPSVASPVLCTELEDNQKIRLLNEGEIKAGDELFAIDIYEA